MTHTHDYRRSYGGLACRCCGLTEDEVRMMTALEHLLAVTASYIRDGAGEVSARREAQDALDRVRETVAINTKEATNG